MQKSSALKRLIVATAMVGAATAYTATPASAGFVLFIQDGAGNAVQIWDNDTTPCQSFGSALCGIAGDGDLGISGIFLGAMTTSSIVGNWTVTGTQNVTDPFTTAPYPHMDMAWSATNQDTDAVPDVLNFYLTDTDFVLNPALYFGSHGGTVAPGASVSAAAYRGDTNFEFDFSNLLFNIPGFNSPGLATSAVIDGATPYSVTMSVQLTHAVSGTSSGNYELTSQQVPEPASMMLLGSGLIGLAARARRRMQRKG